MDDQLSSDSAAAAAAAGSSSCCAASPASSIATWSPLSLCWALELAPFASSAHSHGAAFDSLLLQCEGEDEGGAAERARIQRFHFAADRQRALLGRLAMRAALATTLGQTHGPNGEGRRPIQPASQRSLHSLPRSLLLLLLLLLLLAAWSGVDAGRLRLSRSAYGKPFVLHPAHTQRRVVFNISHHGQFVVLALEAVVAPEGEGGQMPGGPPPYLPLLGCDVTTCALPPGADSVAEYFACMQSCFTHNEWSLIRGDTESDASSSEEPTARQRDAAALMRFAWLWSLKESLIKAVGMGLSFDLQV
jgi:phosphopantetheinyl transferase